jgi:hypothetical protein
VGAGGVNLTWYHLEFLKHLEKVGAPYLIIGGQARAFHYGSDTSDLDLWMPPDNTYGSPVRRAIWDWFSRYPRHVLPPVPEETPLTETSMVQFPNAEVWVRDDLGEYQKITNETRIDVLFGWPGLPFEGPHRCAVRVAANFGDVSVVSKEDLERIPSKPV